MKVADKSKSGRLGGEPKEVCCGEYMKKSYVRLPPDYSACHVGWICMKCGRQILDKGSFKIMKNVLSIE